jgi:hypothetical protein
MDSLTTVERRMLDTEREWWATPGGKEAAVADRFGMSAVRYYQLVARLVSTEAALAYDPITVNRLRRVRTIAARRVVPS